MTDIVRRLRAMSRNEHDDLSIGDEAADEIERLRAEVARLEDIIRKEMWLEAAVKADLEGPYIPWDSHMKDINLLRAEVADHKAAFNKLNEMLAESLEDRERLRAEVANAVDAYKKSLKPVAYMNPEWVKGELWPDDCFIDPGLSIPEDWVPLYRIDGESDE